MAFRLSAVVRGVVFQIYARLKQTFVQSAAEACFVRKAPATRHEKGRPRGAPFGWVRGAGAGPAARSAAVVHLEFHRVGGVLEGVDLFPLEVHVALDLVLREHVARQKEFVVGGQAVHRLA